VSAKSKLLGLVLVLLFAVVSCAGMQLGVNDPVSKFIKLSPQDKATVLMETYSKVYDDVNTTLGPMSNATLAEKQLAVEKAKILISAAPAIKLYVMIVKGGVTPSPADEEAIVKFIRDVISKGVVL